MTLIELLVVIIIVTTLVGAAIPLLSPARDDRRIREASRGVNTYISGAQAKAVALRRPYGVALKKLSNDTENADDRGVCLELFYVEQPPAFRGFADTSAVRVARNLPRVDGNYPQNSVILEFVARGTNVLRDADRLPEGWDHDFFPPMTIRPGDVVETGGSRYRLLADIGNDPALILDSATGSFYEPNTGNPGITGTVTRIVAEPIEDAGQVRMPEVDGAGFNFSVVNDPTTGAQRAIYVDDTDDDNHLYGDPAIPPFWTEPAKYKILRQPMPTSAEPYQLPEGIAIDLRGSGIVTNVNDQTPRGFFHYPEPQISSGAMINNDSPIHIMFTPEGAVDRLYFDIEPADSAVPNEVFNEPVVSNVFLLIGRRENSPPPDTDPTLDPSAIAVLSETELGERYGPINWLNGDSRWVVVGSQSGRVVSTDNAFADLQLWARNPSITTDNAVAYRNGNLLQKRAAQINAAREFARQMTQSGGR